MTAKFGHGQLLPLTGYRPGFQQADSIITPQSLMSIDPRVIESDPASKAAS